MSTEQITKGALGLREAVIMGRIEAKRKYDGVFYSRIVCPALDAYSKPDVVEVRSKSSLGDIGEERQFRVRIGGFAKRAVVTHDKETGENRSFVPVIMTLDAVE